MRKTLKAGETYKNLKKKGFVPSNTKADDHKWLEYCIDGVRILHTKVSHGSNSTELRQPLIHKMAKQCKLTKNQFIDLATCPMSGEQYKKHILSNPDLE
ncbi:MAG: hypothetical protein KAH26_11620 [Bacteroidales bacterium]|nr:hypothetical protein [Bacteroidales bacterium]